MWGIFNWLFLLLIFGTSVHFPTRLDIYWECLPKIDSIIYYEKYVIIQAGAADNGENIIDNELITEEEYLDILDTLPRENQMLEDTDPNKFIAKWC